VRTYSADISSGTFQETFVSATPVDCWALSPRYEFLVVVNKECLSDVEKTGLHDAGYHLEPNKGWLRYNLTFNTAVVNSSIFPSSMLTHNCLYGIHEMVVLPLWTMYLVHFFPERSLGSEPEAKSLILMDLKICKVFIITVT